jgi:transketolase
VTHAVASQASAADGRPPGPPGPPLHDCRKAFATTLHELAAQDERIVVVCNDSVGSSNLVAFARDYPGRLFNVGIAEQDMVGVGAGLANGGYVPFVCAASPFLTGRALEQIKADVAYSGAGVKLCGMSPGLAYGPLGPTHHSIEDLAWLRVLPGLPIVVPADPAQTSAAVRWAAAAPGPAFLRISRTGVPDLPSAELAPGKATLLRDGTDVTLIGNGTMASRCLDAAGLLAQAGLSARVLNMAWLAPLDEEAVIAAATGTGGIVTAEEHSVHGGLGSAVAEVTATRAPARMRILGVPGRFAPTGSTEWLFEHFGLTGPGIADAAISLLGKSGA